MSTFKAKTHKTNLGKVPRSSLPCRWGACRNPAGRDGLCAGCRAFLAGTKKSPTARRTGGRRGNRHGQFYDQGDGTFLLMPWDRHALGLASVVDAWHVRTLAKAGSRWAIEEPSKGVFYMRATRGRAEGKYVHQILMGKPTADGWSIDHLNRCGLDNTMFNLMFASNAEQTTNRTPRDWRPASTERPCHRCGIPTDDRFRMGGADWTSERDDWLCPTCWVVLLRYRRGDNDLSRFGAHVDATGRVTGHGQPASVMTILNAYQKAAEGRRKRR